MYYWSLQNSIFIIRKTLSEVNRWAIYHLTHSLSLWESNCWRNFLRRMLTSDNYYHMILVIIISARGETMLSKALGSGWGILLPGSIIGGLMFADLPIDVWKAMIVSGLLVTSAMIWHKQLRHYVLLPSCVALISGLLVILMSLK